MGAPSKNGRDWLFYRQRRVMLDSKIADVFSMLSDSAYQGPSGRQHILRACDALKKLRPLAKRADKTNPL